MAKKEKKRVEQLQRVFYFMRYRKIRFYAV